MIRQYARNTTQDLLVPCLTVVITITLVGGRTAAEPLKSGSTGPFQANWASLARYECPEWFRDAKFGIYAHWGPYSASLGTRNTDWYSHYMYIPGTRNHLEHKARFGPVSSFGYKDLIPKFTAEKFDADAWVDLYVEAGARFAGPVGEHADGFAMWNSKVTRWNAKAMGPQRDVVGEMARAVRRRHLRFMVSLHHQWKWGWYPTMDANTDTANPEYSGLYGPQVPATAWGTRKAGGRVDVMRPEPRPTSEFSARWLAKVKEVVTNYQPDLLWFDNRMQILPESVRMEMAAFYYNQARTWNRPVVLTYKEPDLKPGTATIDLERSRMPDICPDPWLTDSSVASSSWAYAKDIPYYSTDRLVDDLVDIVSKNGCLLLNIAPHPDGTIPAEQQERLRGIGRWLRINGEAIYKTRPWRVFGEGPTKTKEGHLADLHFDGFSEKDVRYTRSKDGQVLYAILLGWPTESRRVTLKSVVPGNLAGRQIRTVQMLGSRKEVTWRMTDGGMQVTFPSEPSCRHAHVLRLDLGGHSAGERPAVNHRG